MLKMFTDKISESIFQVNILAKIKNQWTDPFCQAQVYNMDRYAFLCK